MSNDKENIDVTFFKNEQGLWEWVVKDTNGRPLAKSAQATHEASWCIRGFLQVVEAQGLYYGVQE